MPFLDARRALNMAGTGRWALTPPFRSYGYRVTEVKSIAHPFGIATGGWGMRGYLSHQPRHIYYAWRGGRIVHSRVVWWCGGYTYKFKLEAEPSKHECETCWFKKTRHEG